MERIEYTLPIIKCPSVVGISSGFTVLIILEENLTANNMYFPVVVRTMRFNLHLLCFVRGICCLVTLCIVFATQVTQITRFFKKHWRDGIVSQCKRKNNVDSYPDLNQHYYAVTVQKWRRDRLELLHLRSGMCGMWERLSSPLSDIAASRKKKKKKALIKKKL